MPGVNPCRELVFSLVFRITLLPVNDRQIIGEPRKASTLQGELMSRLMRMPFQSACGALVLVFGITQIAAPSTV